MANKIYEMVKDRMIAKIEEAIKTGERLPWQKPWSGAHNYVSGHIYKGINAWMLPEDEVEFITFNQIQELQKTKKYADIKLRKGSKSYPVVFWKVGSYNKKVKEVVEGKEEEKLVKKNSFVLKYYNVFKVSDVEGLVSKAKPAEFQNIEKADSFIEEMKNFADIRIVLGSNKAFFSPSRDFVQVPAQSQYQNSNEFYSTLFHELIHWSGAESRLKREFGSFGDHRYSKEELVAEMGSSFLLGNFQINDEKVEENQVAYLQSWLLAIKSSEPDMLVKAATNAQKAAEYLLQLTGVQVETDLSPEEDEITSEEELKSA